MPKVEDDIRAIIADSNNPEPMVTVKEAVELSIITLGVPITVHPPARKGVKQSPFTIREGTEGVIVYAKKIGLVNYHSVHFSPDLPIQLIGYNSLHQYSTVKRHPDDNLKLVLDKVV